PCPRRCQRPRCVCDAGFVRSGGQCIRRAMCPQNVEISACLNNEVYRTCATSCEPTCQNQNPTCSMQCLSPRCQCDSGFVRNSNSQCVREIDVKLISACSANEIFRKCATACEPTCKNQQPNCNSLACGPPKCQCQPGSFR
ncbi:hypothetical protein PENTCL1PPCAC_16249, partial [Pristionchus entomophagus]